MRIAPLASLFSLIMAFATPSHAASNQDLSLDFSNLVNPNGAWSFTQGLTALSHFDSLAPNAINPAATDGYWGTGSNLNLNTPEVIKTTANGSAAGQNDNDFLAGDVILHSTNPGTGADLQVNWTAPAAGSIDYTSSVWYAHSVVQRSNDVQITLNGVIQGGGTVTNGITRINPIQFSGSGLLVASGDTLTFRFMPTPGQAFGSLAGLSEQVVFTASPVPEVPAWALIACGLGLVARVAKRQNAHPRV